MRCLAELSVDWVAAMLCRHPHKTSELGGRIGNSRPTAKAGLPQCLGSACCHRFRSALWMTLCFALFTLCLSASETASPSTPLPSSQEQFSLAQNQGRADTALLDWVMGHSGPLKGDLRTDELRLAFTITPAEGWWDKAGGGELAWHDAPANSVHLRIFVLDLADGRLVPELSVHATLIDSNGNEQVAPVDFGWYPLINAYGGNFPLDADSGYTVRVTVDPLPPLHVFGGGKRFRQTTTAEFPPVQITGNAVAQLPLATATGFANEVELLRPCNVALGAAITALWRQSFSGVEKPNGDYFISYALDSAALVAPVPGAVIHVRNMINRGGRSSLRVVLLARDSRTGRFIPGLKPQANLIAADGKSYGPGELFLAWHPWLNHYGRTARIPREGLYKLHVHFDAPGFHRWGRQSDRFAAPADIEFENLSLTPNEKD